MRPLMLPQRLPIRIHLLTPLRRHRTIKHPLRLQRHRQLRDWIINVPASIQLFNIEVTLIKMFFIVVFVDNASWTQVTVESL